VFVNHLGDRVLEQHDVLVKAFDMALQLDAIDQIDGSCSNCPLLMIYPLVRLLNGARILTVLAGKVPDKLVGK
jgi:hypothetical protein